MNLPCRRGVLRAGILGAGMLAVHNPLKSWAPAQASAPFARHDVASPEGRDMLRIFAEAVDKMTAMPAGDPRGWLFQWSIHAVRDDRSKASELARVYPDPSDPDRALAEAIWDKCEAHFDPLRVNFFLPWHRMYLMSFERIVRSVSGEPRFAMPYWNYTDLESRALPSQFRSPDDPVWKPLFRADRNPGVNDGMPIDQVGEAPLGLNAMMSPVYADTLNGDAGFCANLDNAPHSAVHIDVGTREKGMGAVAWSANDPIFWLHHCNIDRIWASWNRAGGRNPTDQAFLGEGFVFADEGGMPVQKKVLDVLDTVPLGYVYDRYLERPPGSVPFPSASGLAFTEHAASRAVSGPLTLGSAPTTVPLTAAGDSPFFAGLRAASMAHRPFYLRIAGVRITRQPGVSYEVHLDPPPLAAPDRTSRSYVGTINVFGAIVQGTHPGPGPAPYTNPRNYSFVITDLVRNLLHAGRLTEPPSVILVPTGMPRRGATPTVDNISLVSS
ncbi:MAG TPA: tyrosinase family protein [Stellaceae bacterium]|nr:tyrosinase family protein [Stellaceae bacterium]